MIGAVTPEDLRRSPETDWFQLGYDLYSFDDGESYRKIVAAVAANAGSLEVLAFIGTWCGDCQDHLPGFVRILDAAKFPRERLQLFALDRSRTYPGGA